MSDRFATVSYGAHPDQWFRSRGASSAAVCVCFVHGGYWRAPYTAELMEPLARDLSDRRVLGSEIATVNVEYRREADAVAMQDDVRAALRLAKKEFPRALRAVVGHSAGGHLALVTADEAEVVVALAAVTDLVGGYAERIGSGAVAELMGVPPEEDPAGYAAATPQPTAVPTLLVHGIDDDRVPVSHAQRFAAQARAVGAPVDLFEYARLGQMELIDPDGPHWVTVWAWLGERLAGR